MPVALVKPPATHELTTTNVTGLSFSKEKNKT